MEQALTAFVAWLYRQQLSASTVKNYLAAVRFTQISLGLGDPHIGDMPHLSYVVRGMKRLAASGQQRRRLPITPSILLQIKQAWLGGALQAEAVMLWAAATMCFFGFLRVGEIVVPSDKDFDAAYHLIRNCVLYPWDMRSPYVYVKVGPDKKQAPYEVHYLGYSAAP